MLAALTGWSFYRVVGMEEGQGRHVMKEFRLRNRKNGKEKSVQSQNITV